MTSSLGGLHHVTAIASDPQRNIDFYAGVLGLRLVKQTVNFDDPGSYHLYYGDGAGNPGSILTFFAWPNGDRGRSGTGQFESVAFSVPAESFGFWIERLVAKGIPHDHPTRRFGDLVLTFRDPDGIAVDLVADPTVAHLPGWTYGDLPQEHSIRKIHGVTLWEDGKSGTDSFFCDKVGFTRGGDEGNRMRLVLGTGDATSRLDIVRAAGFWEGVIGAGAFHHVAWRAEDDAQQLEWQQGLRGGGLAVTDVRDRQYFHSIYFDEPGGAHQEIATDPPGFATDETADALGGRLQLPPWLESVRAGIQLNLPPIRLPGSSKPIGHDDSTE